MSISIWDTGDVVASLCVTDCDRCETKGCCLQLFVMQRPVHRHHINLCLECFERLKTGVAIAWWLFKKDTP
jgi:hypothetical protein